MNQRKKMSGKNMIGKNIKKLTTFYTFNFFFGFGILKLGEPAPLASGLAHRPAHADRSPVLVELLTFPSTYRATS
jgi:hypothetical protein